MIIKIGVVSFNTRNKKVNLDRRTIKGKSKTRHVTYIAVGVAATAGVAAAVSLINNRF
jgi:hypothetical protein